MTVRIAYCTNVRLPSERAHGHQVARVCDALAKLRHEVQIFAPKRENPITEKYTDFHQADGRVRIEYLGLFNPIDCWYLPKFLQLPLLNFLLCHKLRTTIKQEKFDLLYTRSPALLSTLLATKIPVILELHGLLRRGRQKFVARCNRCVLVVCLTTPMRDELARWKVEEDRIMVEGDAVDLASFVSSPTKAEALGEFFSRNPKDADFVPEGISTIGYVGQLQSMGLSKGIPELLKALKILAGRGRVVRALLAGPPPTDDSLLSSEKNPGASFVNYSGFLKQRRIPHFLAACDVLVYPSPKSDHPFFQRDTSPLKIFEYMAARKPIVAADLPPLRDILSEETAFLCKPGDPRSLADAIERALSNSEEAKAKVERAWRFVQEHTWEKRMQRIMAAYRQR